MKTTAIYYDNFFNIGAPELLEECRYGKEEILTGYKFKKHLWYSFLWELQFLPAENIYVLKTLKDYMYMANSKIFETDPFTPSFTYTDILRNLDIFFERLKMY